MSDYGPHTKDNLFIPDLCHTKAVFLLVLVAELFVLIQVLAFPDTGNFDWDRLAITSLFAQWIALSSAAVLCRLRLLLQGYPVPVVVICVLFTVLTITLLFTLGAQWLLWRDAFLLNFPNGSQLLRHGLIASIMTIMLLRYFYIQHEATQQQVANADARFQALQARIRPHFLFNSMNIIASLIHIDQDKAEQVVEDLSDLFRSSLQETGDTVRLTHEIDLCQRYLRIEQHRLGDRLRSEWHLDDLPDSLAIPPLTLQPVIENAVYHGIQPKVQGGIVSVDISLNNDNVIIRVKNPVPEHSEHSIEKGNHVALDNIKSRLNLLYGYRASVSTRLSLNDGTEIYETIICYPQSKLPTA